MPDARAFAEVRAVIDDRAGMVTGRTSEDQRQTDPHAVARAAVGSQNHFQGTQPAVAVDLGFCSPRKVEMTLS
jgi:hypothetical protein